MQLTAKRGGYFQVFSGDNHISNHTTEREAIQKAIQVKNQYPKRNIHINHDYHVQIGEEIQDVFMLYDCTKLFPQSPMQHIGIAYKNQLWDNHDTQASEFPQQHNIIREAAEMKAINDHIGVIDIEHWKRDRSADGDEVVKKTCDRLCHVLDRFREQLPNMQLGYYSMVPRESYTTDFDKYRDVFLHNNEILNPLAENVDFLAPCFYTRWLEENKGAWAEFAIWTIEQCRQLWPNKPVLPFISPQWWGAVYGEGLQYGDKSRDHVTGEYWQLMLDTLSEHADGAIVWTAYDEDPEVHRQSPWWEVTQEFLKR